MRYGVFFGALAAGLSWSALRGGVPALLLLWPALSAAVVAVGYLGLGPRVVGKRADGTHAAWAWLLHLPFLAVSWLFFHLQRVLLRNDPHNEVAPGLFVGRRCGRHELPDGISFVVDMTAELIDPEPVRKMGRYLCVPTLDGTPPSRDQLDLIVSEIAAHEGKVLVHCAAGRGRAATVAASVLIARGLAETVHDAIALMRRSRPCVRLGRRQRRALSTRVSSPGVAGDG